MAETSSSTTAAAAPFLQKTDAPEAEEGREKESFLDDFSALSEEEVKEAFRLRGKKLGILLAASNFPDEVKESLFSLLGLLSLDQADEFLDMLEAKYLDEATSDIDEVYKTVVEEAQKEIKEI